jgi:hypothetical protein
MIRELPKAIDLEKLSLRAIVAYAARSAHRLSQHLRGEIDPTIVNRLLSLVNDVCTSESLDKLDASSIATAASAVVGAVKSGNKSRTTTLIAVSLSRVAMAAFSVLQAARNSSGMHQSLEYAAQQAADSVQAIDVLDENERIAAIEAALRDFDILVQAVGLWEDPLIGNPVDCFDDVET